MISSISTIAFLICMPTRLSIPSSAMNPKGWPNTSRPTVTPTSTIGTVMKMTAGWRIELNSDTTISIMIRITGGILPARPALALDELSCSPPHSMR